MSKRVYLRKPETILNCLALRYLSSRDQYFSKNHKEPLRGDFFFPACHLWNCYLWHWYKMVAISFSGRAIDSNCLHCSLFSITESEDFLMVQSPLFWTVSNSTISLTEMDRCSDISWIFYEHQNSSFPMISRWGIHVKLPIA